MYGEIALILLVLALLLVIGVVGGYLGMCNPSLVLSFTAFNQTRRNVFLIYVLGPIMLNPLLWKIIEDKFL